MEFTDNGFAANSPAVISSVGADNFTACAAGIYTAYDDAAITNSAVNAAIFLINFFVFFHYETSCKNINLIIEILI